MTKKKDILNPSERKRRQDFLEFLNSEGIPYTINPENEDIVIDVSKVKKQVFGKEWLK